MPESAEYQNINMDASLAMPAGKKQFAFIHMYRATSVQPSIISADVILSGIHLHRRAPQV